MRKFLIGALILLAGCSPADKAKADAKEAITRRINDPESLRFDGMHYAENGVVCGSYNSKNAMGGYGSPTPFAFAPPSNDPGGRLRIYDDPDFVTFSVRHGCLPKGSVDERTTH